MSASRDHHLDSSDGESLGAVLQSMDRRQAPRGSSTASVLESVDGAAAAASMGPRRGSRDRRTASPGALENLLALLGDEEDAVVNDENIEGATTSRDQDEVDAPMSSHIEDSYATAPPTINAPAIAPAPAAVPVVTQPSLLASSSMLPFGASMMNPPPSALKAPPRSILSSAKKPRSRLAMSRAVAFGSPQAAEFHRDSPATSMTPLPKHAARAAYPVGAAPVAIMSDVASAEHVATIANDAALAAWEETGDSFDGDLSDQGSSARRQSGRISRADRLAMHEAEVQVLAEDQAMQQSAAATATRRSPRHSTSTAKTGAKPALSSSFDAELAAIAPMPSPAVPRRPRVSLSARRSLGGSAVVAASTSVAVSTSATTAPSLASGLQLSDLDASDAAHLPSDDTTTGMSVATGSGDASSDPTETTQGLAQLARLLAPTEPEGSTSSSSHRPLGVSRVSQHMARSAVPVSIPDLDDDDDDDDDNDDDDSGAGVANMAITPVSAGQSDREGANSSVRHRSGAGVASSRRRHVPMSRSRLGASRAGTLTSSRMGRAKTVADDTADEDATADERALLEILDRSSSAAATFAASTATPSHPRAGGSDSHQAANANANAPGDDGESDLDMSGLVSESSGRVVSTFDEVTVPLEGGLKQLLAVASHQQSAEPFDADASDVLADDGNLVIAADDDDDAGDDDDVTHALEPGLGALLRGASSSSSGRVKRAREADDEVEEEDQVDDSSEGPLETDPVGDLPVDDDDEDGDGINQDGVDGASEDDIDDQWGASTEEPTAALGTLADLLAQAAARPVSRSAMSDHAADEEDDNGVDDEQSRAVGRAAFTDDSVEEALLAEEEQLLRESGVSPVRRSRGPPSNGRGGASSVPPSRLDSQQRSQSQSRSRSRSRVASVGRGTRFGAEELVGSRLRFEDIAVVADSATGSRERERGAADEDADMIAGYGYGGVNDSFAADTAPKRLRRSASRDDSVDASGDHVDADEDHADDGDVSSDTTAVAAAAAAAAAQAEAEAARAKLAAALNRARAAPQSGSGLPAGTPGRASQATPWTPRRGVLLAPNDPLAASRVGTPAASRSHVAPAASSSVKAAAVASAAKPAAVERSDAWVESLDGILKVAGLGSMEDVAEAATSEMVTVAARAAVRRFDRGDAAAWARTAAMPADSAAEAVARAPLGGLLVLPAVRGLRWAADQLAGQSDDLVSQVQTADDDCRAQCQDLAAIMPAKPDSERSRAQFTRAAADIGGAAALRAQVVLDAPKAMARVEALAAAAREFTRAYVSRWRAGVWSQISGALREHLSLVEADTTTARDMTRRVRITTAWVREEFRAVEAARVQAARHREMHDRAEAAAQAARQAQAERTRTAEALSAQRARQADAARRVARLRAELERLETEAARSADEVLDLAPGFADGAQPSASALGSARDLATRFSALTAATPWRIELQRPVGSAVPGSALTTASHAFSAAGWDCTCTVRHADGSRHELRIAGSPAVGAGAVRVSEVHWVPVSATVPATAGASDTSAFVASIMTRAANDATRAIAAASSPLAGPGTIPSDRLSSLMRQLGSRLRAAGVFVARCRAAARVCDVTLGVNEAGEPTVRLTASSLRARARVGVTLDCADLESADALTRVSATSLESQAVVRVDIGRETAAAVEARVRTALAAVAPGPQVLIRAAQAVQRSLDA